jgi:UDP-N-acetyl-D-glucosamine dehydrogenase
MTLLLGGKLREHSSAADQERQLEGRIRDRTAKIGVIGQGYVGFPLAQQIAQRGYKVLGYDINGDTVLRCKEINRQRHYEAIISPLGLRSCDVLIVAVPTPTRRTDAGWKPDLSYVVAVVHNIADYLIDASKPRLVILESTYAPGTTRRVVAPLLAERHELGRDVFLGYSPERIDPGNARFNIKNTPKVTSGYDAASARLVHAFYSHVVDRAVAASSMEAAEATKILENSFRFVNITFAQEFDVYCDKIGIASREVVELAATKPFGYMPFYAGPGIGGHCIAEDPYFLYQAMQECQSPSDILAAAVRNHESRGSVIVERIARRLAPRSLVGAHILLIGVSYKPGIGDARRSPAAPIIDLLFREGARVDYYDRFVPRFETLQSIDLATADPHDYDLAVIVTRHPDIDPQRLAATGWAVLDPCVGVVPSSAPVGVVAPVASGTRTPWPSHDAKTDSNNIAAGETVS